MQRTRSGCCCHSLERAETHCPLRSSQNSHWRTSPDAQDGQGEQRGGINRRADTPPPIPSRVDWRRRKAVVETPTTIGFQMESWPYLCVPRRRPTRAYRTKLAARFITSLVAARELAANFPQPSSHRRIAHKKFFYCRIPGFTGLRCLRRLPRIYLVSALRARLPGCIPGASKAERLHLPKPRNQRRNLP
jgi:hypothetical protein